MRENQVPPSTDIRLIQKILFAAMRRAAKHVEPTAEGATIFSVVIAEAQAAILTELAGKGTVLRSPGGIETIVRASIDPLERMLRENIAAYLAEEARSPTVGMGDWLGKRTP